MFQRWVPISVVPFAAGVRGLEGVISMPLSTLLSTYRPSILVTTLQAAFRSILLCMDLDHVLIDFFSHAAAGAASVLMVIFIVGLGMPRRAESTIRRNRK